MSAKKDFNMAFRAAARRRSRSGFSMLDLLVSLTLLIAAMSAVTPLIVQHGRVLQSQRHYRLALDELSNQLERLAAIPPDELPTELKHLAPSAFIAERLPGANLTGELTAVEGGRRVTLHITWNEIGRRKQPVTLAAWVFTPPRAAANASEGVEP